MFKTVHKFRINVVNNFGLTKNWMLKGMLWFISYILLFWVDFPTATHRTGKGDEGLPYNLKSVIIRHTVSNLVFQLLYLKHLETSSLPLLHTKNQNAKREKANYRKHLEAKLIGRTQQIERNLHNSHLSDAKVPDPFPYLQISCQRFPFESRFACRYILCDTLGHSTGCSQIIHYRLDYISVSKQHIGILREFYQNYSPDAQIYQASWIGTIPTAAWYRVTLYVAQEQELIWSITFPLYSPNKARFLQSSSADCYRSTAAA